MNQYIQHNFSQAIHTNEYSNIETTLYTIHSQCSTWNKSPFAFTKPIKYLSQTINYHEKNRSPHYRYGGIYTIHPFSKQLVDRTKNRSRTIKKLQHII